MAFIKPFRPGEQAADLAGNSDKPEVEQQAATYAVAGKPGQKAAAPGYTQNEAKHADHDAQCHGMPTGCHHQRNHGNQRAVGAGQVTRRVQETGHQNNEQERRDDHFKAHVLSHEFFRQTQRAGESCHNRSHHHHFADGRGHGGHQVFPLEAVITERQVWPPPPRRHHLQFMLQVFPTRCKVRPGFSIR